MLIAAVTWYLVLMPTGPITPANQPLMKPYVIPDKTFTSELECVMEVFDPYTLTMKPSLTDYLHAHGLTDDATKGAVTANFTCESH